MDSRSLFVIEKTRLLLCTFDSKMLQINQNIEKNFYRDEPAKLQPALSYLEREAGRLQFWKRV